MIAGAYAYPYPFAVELMSRFGTENPVTFNGTPVTGRLGLIVPVEVAVTGLCIGAVAGVEGAGEYVTEPLASELVTPVAAEAPAGAIVGAGSAAEAALVDA